MENKVLVRAGRMSGLPETVTPNVARLQDFIVNCYLVAEPSDSSWVVIDTGIFASAARRIIAAAEARFGRGSKPAAILLTHGHFDHVGAAGALSRRWNVPIYAHELELPYLTGRSSYPPPDPTVGGGWMARLSLLFPRRPIQLRNRVLPLPSDGTVPGLPGWRWLHTPGHSPGHVSFFREADRTLIAGDAFVTVKQESVWAVLRQRQEVSRPPAYFTPDWRAARQSVKALANLEPAIAATGHGVPMRGERLLYELKTLAENFDRVAVPQRGRYVRQPAVADGSGVVFVPPPVPNPFPKVVGGILAVAATAVVINQFRRQRRRRLAFEK